MRRSFLRIFTVLLVSCHAASAGPFSWIHEWQSDRSVDAANEALAQNDSGKAALALQRALQLNGNNRRALELMAKLSAASSPVAEAQWRRRILDLNPKDPQTRGDYCTAATRAGDLVRAQEAMGQWPADQRRTLPYFRAAGQLALAKKSYSEALDNFREALRLPGATASDRLNVATTEIFSRNPFERGEALSTLEELTKDPETELTARRTLIARSVNVSDLDEARVQTDELLTKAFTKENVLLACDVYSRSSAPALPDLVTRALDKFRADPLFQAQLLDWLNRHDRASVVLQAGNSLAPAAARNPYLKYAWADALDRLGKWDELFGVTEKDSWEALDLFRLAYKVRAESMRADHHGDERAVVWKRCLGAAGRNVKALWILVDLANRWSWQPQFEEALWAVGDLPTASEPALQKLDQIYRARKDTAGLFRLAKRTLELKPEDEQAANEYVRTGLLLNVNRDTYLDFARQKWESNQNRSPKMTAVYAYALSLQGKVEDAVRVLETLTESDRRNEALYVGLVRAAISDRKAAMDYLRLARQTPLLPQEEVLLEQVLAGLASSS